MSQNNPPDQPWPQPYERPSQKWLCSRTDRDRSGPCPLGPDQRGRCRTEAECKPALELKAGEQKGRYRCTRSPEYGGPCHEGPLPTGVCSHPLPRCAPIRSWRSRRAVFTWWVLGLTVASLLLLMAGRWRFAFANPGPISTVHSRPRGGRTDLEKTGEQNCGACHRRSTRGLRDWAEAAAGAEPGPLQFAAFVRPPASSVTRMDAVCSDCHRQHQFHHVNMKEAQSCLKCHREHHGDEGLRLQTDQQCVTCHGNQTRLTEVSHLPASVLPQPVTRFSRNHPEFAPLARKMTDPNTLRFDHRKHLSAEVLGANGQRLQCSACHQEDVAGEYHQPIRFAQHCQSCHSLQFDPATPELHLPHGDVEFVKAFLGSLPRQYAQFAERARGLTEKRKLDAFVQTQMQRLESEQIAGQSLEQQILFSKDRRGGTTGQTAAFYGCAFCHEVNGRGSAITVTKPTTPVRWLKRGEFHHRQHQTASCTTCHQVEQSTQTADILIPSVKTCATCHNSNAAPGESCMLCHDYHHWRGELQATAAR